MDRAAVGRDYLRSNVRVAELRSPLIAMLWETWRVTRVEAAWRLALGTVGALATATLIEALSPDVEIKKLASKVAVGFIVLPHYVGWLSLSKLNGGRPGFPFRLLFTQPVRTSVLVGVPVAYLVSVPPAIYWVSAFLLRATMGYPFPLLPGVAWVASLNVMVAAANWWTSNGLVRILGVMAVSAIWVVLALGGLDDLRRTLYLPLAYYIPIGAIGLAAFGLTVVGVARQRRGGGQTTVSLTDIRDRFSSLLVNLFVSLFPFPCPISSATRAQIWFELRSGGLPLLAIAVAIAIANPLLYAVGVPIDAAIESGQFLKCRIDGCFYGRAFAVMFAALSVPGMLVFGVNAFGLRAKQGRVYISPFDATQPYGTGRLAILKVLVRSISLATALAVIVGGAWVSGLFAAAIRVFLGDPRIFPRPPEIQRIIGALTGASPFALIVVASIGVLLWVAAWAASGGVVIRYPGRISRAVSLLILYGLALGVLALAERRGIGPAIPLGAILRVSSWVAMAAISVATVYLFWRTFAERLLTLPQALGGVLVSATFGVAWATLLKMNVTWMLMPALLSLMLTALVPWSLSRIRHM